MFDNFSINIINILLDLPAVFLALSFHEFAHAFAADRQGDPTPRNLGRLTLDPLVHIDWLGFIFFVILGFGWAKPVSVNISNFKNKKWGDIIVSAAGPLANLLLAVVAAVIYSASIFFIKNQIIVQILGRIVHLNVLFALLNLVPIPPFDGYNIIKSIFFRRNVNFFWRYEEYSRWILIACLLLGIFDEIVGKPAFFISSILIGLSMLLF